MVSGRFFLIPFFNIGGTRTQFDVEDIDYIKKSVVDYELHFESQFKDDLDDPEIQDMIWYRQLQAKIPKDSIILDVYAVTMPDALVDSKRVKIAEIKLLTELYTSKHGDERLYFQHRKIQRDRKYYPKEWKQIAKNMEECFDNSEENTWGREVPENVWPKDADDAKAFFESQQRQSGCPFAWLLNPSK